MTEANLKVYSVQNSAKFTLDVMSGALGMLSYIILFAWAGITLLVGVGVTYETPNAPIGLLIASILISLIFFLVGWSLRHILVTSGSLRSKLNTIKWTIVRWWGMLFRTVFISSIGFSGYFWFNPQPLGDIPISQLTLNQIFGNLFGVAIPLGCIFWLFNFPDEKKSITKDPSSSPYYLWGGFGALATFIILVISLLVITLIL